MIPDSKTNFLYLAGCLPELFPEFYDRFKKVLTESSINFELLPNTKDVWVRDYMPVQIGVNDFVQFVYDPDYLKPKEYMHLKSNPDEICTAIQINPRKSKLVIDGGNVNRTSDKVIMCDKLFKEIGRAHV